MEEEGKISLEEARKIKEDYNNNKMLFYVNRALAKKVCNSDFIAKRYKYAYLLWLYIAFFAMLGGIVLFFFVAWYYAVGAIILGIIINQANAKSADQHVLEYALENDDFLRFAINIKLIKPADREHTEQIDKMMKDIK